MRKPFAATMALVPILGSTSPGVRPAFPHTASAYAPPPPTLPAPTPSPGGPDIAGRPLPTPPSPGDLPADVEEARARQAIEAVLERYWGPRYQVAPVEVTLEGEWAHGVAKWRSQTRTLKEPIHILAHRLPDGTWQALEPKPDLPRWTASFIR